MLPRWRHKSLILGILFFVSTWLLIDFAWSMHQLLMPIGWSEGDFYLWFFHFSPYAVALQFGIGVAAYRISLLPLPSSVTRLASELGAIGLVVIQALAIAHWIDHTNNALPAAIATAALMIGARSDSLANRLLSARSIVYVGTISYSLYLFHALIPPLALHGRSFDIYGPTAAFFHAVNFVSSIALAIIFATGVYHLIEVRGRRYIRAAADRLLGVGAVPIVRNERAPAE
jgi:peptidoglycan/LPS O-acetylase OafA/YrhL